MGRESLLSGYAYWLLVQKIHSSIQRFPQGSSPPLTPVPPGEVTSSSGLADKTNKQTKNQPQKIKTNTIHIKFRAY